MAKFLPTTRPLDLLTTSEALRAVSLVRWRKPGSKTWSMGHGFGEQVKCDFVISIMVMSAASHARGLTRRASMSAWTGTLFASHGNEIRQGQSCQSKTCFCARNSVTQPLTVWQVCRPPKQVLSPQFPMDPAARMHALISQESDRIAGGHETGGSTKWRSGCAWMSNFWFV